MGDLSNTTELLEFSEIMANIKEAEVNSVNGSKILVVDDEPAIQRAVRRVLKSLGITIEVAGNAVEAIEQLSKERFDLIISDVHMRGGDGIELLQHLRKSDQITPVIMFSGSPTVESAIAAVNYRAFHYLTKPFSFDQLRDLAEDAIRGARIEQRRSTLSMSLGRKQSLDERQFESAMHSIWVAKQPIVNTRKNSVGFEVLVRTDEAALKSPESFWFCATSLGREKELSHRIRHHVVELLNDHPHHIFFYNIHESELFQKFFIEDENMLHPYAKRVVLEISDKKDMESLTLENTVSKLRQRGYRFAIDNFGTGSSSMELVFQIKPDYVKLDRALIGEIRTNKDKRKRVRRLLKVCKDINIAVIAEQVESQTDFEDLKDLGVEIFQGFLFGRPGA